MTLQLHSKRTWIAQALGFLCVCLIFFAASVQVTHVHPESARHDCSICSIAHAGVIATGTFEAVPVQAGVNLEYSAEPLVRSAKGTSVHFIRPPPSV